MFDIKRLLSYAYPEALVEVSTASNGVDQNVILSNISKDNVGFVSSIMEGAGYVFTENGKELSSLGTYEFTSISSYEYMADGEVANYEYETDGLEDSGSDVADGEFANSGVASIDGDGRAFRVLTTPEMHKFAMKVYTGMLGNTENMANYGIFAYDLDNFLSMHINSDPNFDEEEGEGKDEDGGIAVPEAASVTVEELASIILTSDGDAFLTAFGKYLPETANSKIIGKIILGIMVKIVGGAVGKALLAAWERRNKSAFERILFSIVKILLNDWFPEGDFEYKSEVRKYKEYEFDDEYKYEIDLDDYTVENAEAFIEGSEVALKPGTIGIIKLLIAVFIKIMATALGRMLIDSWIKRDKKKFERTLMYFMLEVMKYVPFKGYLESASIEVFDDSFSIDYASLTEPVEEVEIAKKKKEKKGRGALLSAMMRALSGDAGDKAVSAWDNGDMDSMVEIMGKVTEKVLEAMPYDESQDDDSSVEETEPTEETTESIPDTTATLEDV